MASKMMLVFATMLFYALGSMSIRGQDLSKHQNNFELGLTGGPKASNSPQNSSRGISTQGFTQDLIVHLGLTGGPKASNSPQNSSRGISTQGFTQDLIVHVAGYQSKGYRHGGTLWHGVRAEMTLWETPDVHQLSSSGAYIAAINQATGLDKVAAGAHVNPALYGDNKLHFFTYWQSTTSTSRGCYNDKCPGFVIANEANTRPGQAFAPPLSTYGGEQRVMTIRIKKDEHTGDWSLYREDLGGMTLLGWWPSSLFTSLSAHAQIIQWTGFVDHYNVTSTPSMGSGHYSSELEGKAASFNDCFGFDENGYVYKEYYDATSDQDVSDCYNVSPWYETDHPAKRHFFYGGPGGCPQ